MDYRQLGVHGLGHILAPESSFVLSVSGDGDDRWKEYLTVGQSEPVGVGEGRPEDETRHGGSYVGGGELLV